MFFLTNWIELNALHSYCLSFPSFCKWTKLSYTRKRDDVLTVVLPSPSWSSSLLRLVNPDYVWITILRNVGKYKSSRRNTPEDMNQFFSFPSSSSYHIYSIRSGPFRCHSCPLQVYMSVQWRLLLNSVTVLFLPRRRLYRRVSGFMFRTYMSFQLFWIQFKAQSLSLKKLGDSSHEQITTDTFLLLNHSQFVTE